MAVDFPSAPTIGQIVGTDGASWRWDGTAWVLTGGAPSAHGAVAYAKITAAQGGIVASPVNINGLSVTFVANPARTYRTTVFGTASSTVNNDVLNAWILDGPGTTVIQTYLNPYLNNSTSSTATFSVVETGLSGTITRKVGAQRGAGTGTLTWYASPTIPSFIVVEDITYEGPPLGGAEVSKIGRWRRVANQLFTANVQADVVWDTEDYDPYNMGAAGTAKITVPEAGIWAVSCILQWGGIQTTRSFGQITLSSTVPNHWPQHRIVCTSDDRACLSPVMQLNGGDFFTVSAFCSAANANLTGQLQVSKVGNIAP